MQKLEYSSVNGSHGVITCLFYFALIYSNVLHLKGRAQSFVLFFFGKIISFGGDRPILNFGCSRAL